LRAVIFANGELNDSGGIIRWIAQDDLLITADGGSRHCLTLKLTPDIIIGDFDSLAPELLQAFERQGSQTIQHPARKDFTDLELALRYACERGVDDILVFGALGARWDQTLANLLLPAHPDLITAQIRLIDANQEITLIRAGQTSRVHGLTGDTVSLIPIRGEVNGISTQGLEYPLSDETLDFGATRGVSNVLLESQAEIFIRDGLLLCIIIHQEGYRHEFKRGNKDPK
jgi:thiamine pyrophosphokinase